MSDNIIEKMPADSAKKGAGKPRHFIRWSVVGGAIILVLVLALVVGGKLANLANDAINAQVGEHYFQLKERNAQMGEDQSQLEGYKSQLRKSGSVKLNDLSITGDWGNSSFTENEK